MGFYDDIGDFPVQGFAGLLQLFQQGFSIVTLEQGPFLVPFESLGQALQRHVQIDNGSAANELLAVLLRKDRATT